MEPTANVKKAERLRYWVTFLMKNFSVGDNFKPDALHLTIVPWFVADKSEEEIIKSFYDFLANQKPIEVTIGQIYEFKNKRKIPINIVRPSKELAEIHSKTLGWLDELEARWAVKNPHVGDDYIPHVRRRQGHNLSEGDKLKINSLSLVSARRRGDDERTVVAKVRFDEKS